ncbi:LOW QUALITY PROTEIN: putative lysosomal acid lipase/cholesteryl ester hydrolase [Spheniscus humboldti]
MTAVEMFSRSKNVCVIKHENHQVVNFTQCSEEALVLWRHEMWQLLVALCLDQGLGDTIACTGVSHDNSEQFRNISQIIRFHGFRSEDHQVLTDDGYFLTVNWIPGGREEAGSRGTHHPEARLGRSPSPKQRRQNEDLGSRLPVLLQHGLVLDGSNWVSNFPNSSLGFILMDTGYNVWIGNSQGNSWSRRHLNLSVDQEEFWDFSFHEMAVYDLPAMVGFILRQTRQEKLFYVGHDTTQGKSLGFIAFSSMPQLAENIKMFFVVGPAYTLYMGKGPVLSLFYLPGAIIKLDLKMKVGFLLPITLRCPKVLVSVTEKSGGQVGTQDTEIMLKLFLSDVYLSHFPNYASTKSLLHWGQTAKTGEFKQFDYGKKNKKKYNQTSPPFYRVEHMMVPTTLWSGREDHVTSTTEAQCLLPCITNLVRHEHFPDWNCWDHMWGLDTPQHMYRQMVTLMIHERHVVCIDLSGFTLLGGTFLSYSQCSPPPAFAGLTDKVTFHPSFT